MLLTILCIIGIFFAPSKGKEFLVFYDTEKAETLFAEFIETFNKSYSSEEKQTRLGVFRKNLEEINHLNTIDSATFGINQFTDLTKEEFVQKYASHKRMPFGNSCYVKTDGNIVTHDAPETLDWRTQRVVTSVKNQGPCEAGWAFAVIGNVEGQFVKKHGDLQEFSVQQLLDCLSECGGCKGCNSNTAMSSLVDLGGVQLESDYSYTGKAQCCQYKPGLAKVQPIDCTTYDLWDENKLKEVLAKVGPLYIAVDGTSLLNYRHGILENCPFKDINQAVLLIGYGSEGGKDYWLIKSSWGTAWGDRGFAKIRRGVNACGLMNPDIASVIVK